MWTLVILDALKSNLGEWTVLLFTCQWYKEGRKQTSFQITPVNYATHWEVNNIQERLVNKRSEAEYSLGLPYYLPTAPHPPVTEERAAHLFQL